ncbi:UNVERIFIED_CONTAM: Histone acetyltransferase HAC1, partial [Sesamum indicum]
LVKRYLPGRKTSSWYTYSMHVRTHCCILMISGNCWVCKRCKDFQLCENKWFGPENLVDANMRICKHVEKEVMIFKDVVNEIRGVGGS